MLGGAVARARVDADHAERRVFAEDVEERERRAVRDAVRAAGGDPGDRAGDHQPDQEFVDFEGLQLSEPEIHQACFQTLRSREARSGTASARYFLKCGVCWCASNALSSS